MSADNSPINKINYDYFIERIKKIPCDFEIICKDGSVKCVKNMIVASSDYIKLNLLDNNITLPETSIITITEIINYIQYNHSINVRKIEMPDMLLTLNKYFNKDIYEKIYISYKNLLKSNSEDALIFLRSYNNFEEILEPFKMIACYRLRNLLIIQNDYSRCNECNVMYYKRSSISAGTTIHKKRKYTINNAVLTSKHQSLCDENINGVVCNGLIVNIEKDLIYKDIQNDEKIKLLLFENYFN